MSDNNEELFTQLNNETAKLSWKELERHFARGSVIKVAEGQDLIHVAASFANDDAKQIEKQIEKGEIAHASMDDARLWNETDAQFWAVVVAPWVLIQHIKPRLNS